MIGGRRDRVERLTQRLVAPLPKRPTGARLDRLHRATGLPAARRPWAVSFTTFARESSGSGARRTYPRDSRSSTRSIMPCFVIRARRASSVSRVPERRSMCRNTAACPGRASGYPRSARAATSSAPSARCDSRSRRPDRISTPAILHGAATAVDRRPSRLPSDGDVRDPSGGTQEYASRCGHGPAYREFARPGDADWEEYLAAIADVAERAAARRSWSRSRKGGSSARDARALRRGRADDDRLSTRRGAHPHAGRPPRGTTRGAARARSRRPASAGPRQPAGRRHAPHDACG